MSGADDTTARRRAQEAVARIRARALRDVCDPALPLQNRRRAWTILKVAQGHPVLLRALPDSRARNQCLRAMRAPAATDWPDPPFGRRRSMTNPPRPDPQDARLAVAEQWQRDPDRACNGLRGRVNLDAPPALAGRGLRRWAYACAALTVGLVAWWLA